MVQILIEIIVAGGGRRHSDASALGNDPASSRESRPAGNTSDGLLGLDLHHIFN